MTRLALSFDNGPDPEVTPEVLRILAERKVRASFFVLGKNLESAAGRDLVRAAHAAGHVVGNHSYSHEIPLGDDPRADVVEQEIVRTEQLLLPLLEGAPRLFRPFGGGGKIGPHLLRPSVVEYLRAHDYSCVLWNSVPRDWDDPDGWPARALQECATGEHVSMVLHDIPGASLAGLASFLDTVLAQGVELVLEQPPECVPIQQGRVVADLTEMVRV